MTQIDGLGLSLEQIKIIVQNPIPVISAEDEGPMTLLQLHLLSKKLADLPRDAQIQCVRWYYKQLALPEIDCSSDIRVVFKNNGSHAKVTRELDKLVTRKLDETRLLQKITKM